MFDKSSQAGFPGSLPKLFLPFSWFPCGTGWDFLASLPWKSTFMVPQPVFQ